MISFSLKALVITKYHSTAKFHGSFSAADVDSMAVKYFGKHVNGIENKKYMTKRMYGKVIVMRNRKTGNL